MPLYRLSGVNSTPTINGTTVFPTDKKWNVIVHGINLNVFWSQRLAFLALVELNAFGLADKFTAIFKDKGETPLSNWWYNIGGDFSAFKKSVIKGAKNKRIFGVKIDNSNNTLSPDYQPSRIGDAALIAGYIAAAGTIIAAAVPVIKNLGQIATDINTTGKNLKEGGSTPPVINPPINPPPPVKDNTFLYVGIAAGAVGLAVVGKKLKWF